MCLGRLCGQAAARARRAVKQRGRSLWPEFAVKVVPTVLIRAMGYEKNVIREMAILRQLSHPGVARMVRLHGAARSASPLTWSSPSPPPLGLFGWRSPGADGAFVR